MKVTLYAFQFTIARSLKIAVQSQCYMSSTRLRILQHPVLVAWLTNKINYNPLCKCLVALTILVNQVLYPKRWYQELLIIHVPSNSWFYIVFTNIIHLLMCTCTYWWLFATTNMQHTVYWHSTWLNDVILHCSILHNTHCSTCAFCLHNRLFMVTQRCVWWQARLCTRIRLECCAHAVCC